MPHSIVYEPLDELVKRKHPQNPKTHDIPSLAESIERFKFASPVLLDERTNLMAAGHGRLEALLYLRDKDEEPPEGVVEADDGTWMVPTVHGWSSEDDDELIAYVIADNRQNELGGWDTPLLGSIMSQLAKTSKITGTGFTGPQLDDLMARLAPPPSLDQLRAAHGAPNERDMWPVLRFQVHPDVRDRYTKMVASEEWEGDREDESAIMIALIETYYMVRNAPEAEAE